MPETLIAATQHALGVRGSRLLADAAPLARCNCSCRGNTCPRCEKIVSRCVTVDTAQTP